MARDHLHLQHFGPITDADLHFGDLTVLVGHQGSGKSIALQMLRLLTDRGHITRVSETYGRGWNSDNEFAEMYFGEGMHSLLSGHSTTWNGKPIPFAKLTDRRGMSSTPTCFYIPAQRVMAFSREGWLRPFSEFPPGTPFAVSEFSDQIRLLLEQEFDEGKDAKRDLFPRDKRLPGELRAKLLDSIFQGFSLKIERQRATKRLTLSDGKMEGSLPYMAWSAGQRESVPWLLGLYWLMPAGMAPRRGSIKRVVLEELEMGLHPKAITVVLTAVCELLARGYHVSLTTHSPQVLDLVWALGELKQKHSTKRDMAGEVLRLLSLPTNAHTQDMATKLLTKTSRAYFFTQGKPAVDISGLDPGSGEAAEATWGGLSEFSGIAAQVVSDAQAGHHG